MEDNIDNFQDMSEEWLVQLADAVSSLTNEEIGKTVREWFDSHRERW